MNLITRTATAAAIAGLALTLTPSAGAQAVAYSAAKQPLRIIISGPSTTISTQVVSTATTGTGGHMVLLTGAGAAIVGETRRAQDVLVTLRQSVSSKGLTPGAQTWVLQDIGDGKSTPVAVKILRQSRIPTSTLVVVPAGVAEGGGSNIFVQASIQHYNQAARGWMGSKASPVQAQCRTTRGWMTYATLKTDANGMVSAMTVAPAKCVFGVRLVRPEGANVTSTTSATIPVHFV